MTDPKSRLESALSDRYRLGAELGQGGMATVYLAHDLRHDRKVAIKVLHPELSALLGAERFLSEIKTTAALQHPHILPLFDSGTVDGLLFSVMPLVEGETLRARLNREKQLPVGDAVWLASEVASALAVQDRVMVTETPALAGRGNRNYDVAPDGSGFLMLRSSTPARLVVRLLSASAGTR